MMDEPSVKSTIPVYKWVDVDEPKGKRRSGDNGVEAEPPNTIVKDFDSAKQSRKVSESCADMLRQWFVRVAIMLPNETFLFANAELYKSAVLNH
jgi:hypothetical protein